MTILFSNNASTTISGSITALDTTVALAAGSGVLFPHPVGGDYFVCTFYDQATKTINEIVHVTNVTGDVATITRAQEGTTAAAWNTGDIFANLITAGTLEAFVQAGTGPADTSLVYVGTDTGTPNHIVAVTNPVPSHLAIGMLFNIKVANANTTITDVALNGGPAITAKHTDGSDFRRGDIYAGLEYTFVYNGTTFSSTIMNVPQKPPQYIFYVRSDSTSTVNSDGTETNTGFANTPTSAFKTLQGALNTIEATYISTATISIRVADGTYAGGFKHTTQYVNSYDVGGNDSNPGACIIDATSIAPAAYVPGAPVGCCVFVGEFGNVNLHGFALRSYQFNIAADVGILSMSNIFLTSPSDGIHGVVESTLAARITLTGNIHVSTPTAAAAVFYAHQNGLIAFGIHDIASLTPVNLYLDGTASGSTFLRCNTGGTITVVNDSGVVNLYGSWPFQGYELVVGNAGGVAFNVGTTYFPSTNGQSVTPPGYVT